MLKNKTETVKTENEMAKIIYLIIYFYRKEEKAKKTDEIKFNKNEKEVQCIYTKKNENKNNLTEFIKVIKSKVKVDKKMNYNIDFSIENEKYNISFDAKNSYFIYDLSLTLIRSFQTKKSINQNSIKYYEKMNYFIDALIQNKEEEKLDILYQDAINLYSLKPDFEFLINLFIKIYDNKKNCPILLDKFKQFNTIKLMI